MLQDADGPFARHAQRFAQHARGGSAAGSLDSGGDKLPRMRLHGDGQGNIALDLHDGAVERKLAQSSRHDVAVELQSLTHLGQRRRIEAGPIEQRHNAVAGLVHHACGCSGRVWIEYLGALGGAHAARTALGNQGCGNRIVSGRPRSMGDGARRKARLLGSRRVHGGQGHRQDIHRGVKHGGIRIQRAVRAGKLASNTSRYQLVQRGIGLTGNKI